MALTDLLPPGLAGWEASRQARAQREGQQLQQATGLMALMQHAQQQEQAKQEYEQKLRTRNIMAQTGGDLEKAIPALIQSGAFPPEHIPQLMKAINDAREAKAWQGAFPSGGAAPTAAPAVQSPVASSPRPGDINFMAANNDAMGLPPPPETPTPSAELTGRAAMAKQYRDRANALAAPFDANPALAATARGAAVSQEIARLMQSADRLDPAPKYHSVGNNLVQEPSTPGQPVTPVYTAPQVTPMARPMATGTTRSVQRGTQKVTEELQSDGTWKEIGTGPQFARQVAPVINVGATSDISASPLSGKTPSDLKSMSWDNFAKTMKVPLSGGALQMASLDMALTGKMPSMGMGGKGVPRQVRLAVMEGRAKVAADFDTTPEEMVLKPTQWKADAASYQKLTQKLDAVSSVMNSFHNNIATFERIADGQPPQLAPERFVALGSAFKKIDFTDVKTVNNFLVSVRSQFNDPATVAYLTAATTVAMDYARILSSQGMSAAQITDSARAEASKLVSVGYNKQARQGLLGALESDTAGQIKGMSDQRNAIRQRMGLSGASSQTPAQNAAPTAAPLSLDDFLKSKGH